MYTLMCKRSRKLENCAACFHCKMMSTDSSKEVILEEVDGAGIITLNRPKALNALNLPMIDEIMPRLTKWDEDSSVKMILIKGMGDKAFCAGGDVRAIAEAGKKGDDLTKTFFRDEYILNHKIGTLKTPYVALIDGITMGGGVGLSVHGKYRVATEKTLFAMPETAIGFFPDVGGGYFLPRLEGSLGPYFALTGNRLRGRDVLFAGVATHFVSSELIPDLEKELISSSSDVEGVLSEFHKKSLNESETFSLTNVKDKINSIFSAESVELIFKRLEEDGSEWSLKQLEIMKKMSPTSMCVTLEQVKRGGSMSFDDVFKMEYRMSQKFMKETDFYEGIRAVLVDKDNKPSWSPSTINEVKEEAIQSYFASLPADQELVYP